MGSLCRIVLALAALAGAVACSSDAPSEPAGTGGSGTGGTSGPDASADGDADAGADADASADAGAAGSDAGSGGSAGSAGAPALLSETGLYADIGSGELGPGVVGFQPRYALWTDGAVKQRWVALPPGEVIDTSDLDYWVYPVGTKLWKEFVRDGTRVETRLLHKVAPSQWLMMAYHWNAAQTDATAVPAGVQNASGTPHDIPSAEDCKVCHAKMVDRVLGLTALQLSHQLGGLTLEELIAQGKLSAPPSSPPALPGTATDQEALGVLHANCGVCHNQHSVVFTLVNMQLWLEAGSLGSVVTTGTYQTTVNQPLTAPNPTTSPARVVPGSPADSDVHVRMSQRGTLHQMPPLGTELVDPVGLGAVDAWIQGL